METAGLVRKGDPIAVIGGGLIGISWTALFLAWGHDVALFELLLEPHRPDLPAGERDVGDLLGEPHRPLNAALLGRRVVAGDAFDERVVEPVYGKLVVRRQRPPHGRFVEDPVGLLGERRKGEGEQEC